MYLDTDIILGLIKKKDWLKPHIRIERIKNPKTSVLALIEAELVLDREYGREHIFSVHDEVKKLGIKILPLEEGIVKKSLELMKTHPYLNIFDSMHVAFSVLKNETIISTDTVFKRVKEAKCADPRGL